MIAREAISFGGVGATRPTSMWAWVPQGQTDSGRVAHRDGSNGLVCLRDGSFWARVPHDQNRSPGDGAFQDGTGGATLPGRSVPS
jgi:hypothetical protein